MNQNNRRRAFVTAADITVDVMIDGLMLQNRAMDGDTVIVELLDPFKWTEYTTTNSIVVGKTSTGQNNVMQQMGNTFNGKPGYTNDTAVETRIIDMEVLGRATNHESGVSSEDDVNKLELLAVTKEFTSLKIKEEKKQSTSGGISEGSEQSDSSDSDEEEDAIEKALEDAQDDSDDIGTGFIDDEQVSSDEDEEEDNEDQSSEEEEENQDEKDAKEKTRTPVKGMGKDQVQTKNIAVKRNPLLKIEGKNKQERLAEINKIAKDLRPMGRVKAIIKSPNRDKEHLVTLMALEKNVLDTKALAQFTNNKSAS